MSTTTTPPVSVRDQLFAQAKSLPDYLAMAESADPTMAAAVKGEAQAASATPPGALISAGLAWLAAHYGLGWGVAFDDTAAGLTIVLGGYLTHWVQLRMGKAKIASAPAATVPAL